MTFNEAVRILKAPHVPGMQGYIDHATASAVYYANNAMRTDHPAATRDQWRSPPRFEGGGGDIGEATPTGTTFGAQSAGRSGAKLVQRLPGPVSSYFVAALGDGTAGLYQTVESDGAGDPGRTSLTGDAVRRIRNADATKSRSALTSINERNRRFWANR